MGNHEDWFAHFVSHFLANRIAPVLHFRNRTGWSAVNGSMLTQTWGAKICIFVQMCIKWDLNHLIPFGTGLTDEAPSNFPLNLEGKKRTNENLAQKRVHSRAFLVCLSGDLCFHVPQHLQQGSSLVRDLFCLANIHKANFLKGAITYLASDAGDRNNITWRIAVIYVTNKVLKFSFQGNSNLS